jgi:hypothetical protein
VIYTALGFEIMCIISDRCILNNTNDDDDIAEGDTNNATNNNNNNNENLKMNINFTWICKHRETIIMNIEMTFIM